MRTFGSHDRNLFPCGRGIRRSTNSPSNAQSVHRVVSDNGCCLYLAESVYAADESTRNRCTKRGKPAVDAHVYLSWLLGSGFGIGHLKTTMSRQRSTVFFTSEGNPRIRFESMPTRPHR